MNKKAVDLTINTVVVAILAILVLAVLFYVFTNKMGGFSQKINTCPGTCVDSEATCVRSNGAVIGGTADYPNCKDSAPLCCSV